MPAAQTNIERREPELQPDGLHDGQFGPGPLRAAQRVPDPPGTTGPANADSEIQADNTVVQGHHPARPERSEVLLGNTLMVPVGKSMVYLRPLYVASTTNPQPPLEYVIGVVGQRRSRSRSTVGRRRCRTSSDTGVDVPSGGQGSGGATASRHPAGTVSAAVQQDLNQAQTDYQNAQAALKHGDLGHVPERHHGHGGADRPGPGSALNAPAGTDVRATTTTTPPRSRPRPRPRRPRPRTVPTSTAAQGLDDLTTPGSSAARQLSIVPTDVRC